MSPHETRLAALNTVLEAARRHDIEAQIMALYGRNCQDGMNRVKAAYKAAFDWGLEEEITRIGREKQEKREKEKFIEALEKVDLGELDHYDPNS